MTSARCVAPTPGRIPWLKPGTSIEMVSINLGIVMECTAHADLIADDRGHASYREHMAEQQLRKAAAALAQAGATITELMKHVANRETPTNDRIAAMRQGHRYLGDHS